MADKRTWAKVDVGYLDNPKMSDVLDASSNAVCMHLASMLHSAQHLTDGFVSPVAMRRKVGGDASDTQILIDAGLWHEAGHNCPHCPQPPENRVFVHDYPQHNRCSDDVNAASEKARQAANARWNNDASSNASSMPDAMQNAMQKEREKERVKSEVADATSRPDIDQILDLLADRVEANGVKRPTKTKTAKEAARKLIDIDGYSVHQIEWMIRWATDHEFWRSTILSMSKLRQKFDQLKLQATAGKHKINMDGDIDVEAILGKDYWQPGTPPEGLSIQEEIDWKKQQRAEHNAGRLEQAKAKVANGTAA